MNNFTFNPENHEYKIDNRPVVGVTSVIKSNFGERPWYSDYSKDKGTALHLACKYFDEGRLKLDSVDNRIMGKLNGYKKFRNTVRYPIYKAEYSVYSKKYNFAGTIDQILSYLLYPGHYILADIKSSYDPVVLIQLAGYYLCLQEQKEFKNKISEALVIILKDDGNFDTKWLSKRDLEINANVFLASLTMKNFKIKNNLEEI